MNFNTTKTSSTDSVRAVPIPQLATTKKLDLPIITLGTIARALNAPEGQNLVKYGADHFNDTLRIRPPDNSLDMMRVREKQVPLQAALEGIAVGLSKAGLIPSVPLTDDSNSETVETDMWEGNSLNILIPINGEQKCLTVTPVGRFIEIKTEAGSETLKINMQELRQKLRPYLPRVTDEPKETHGHDPFNSDSGTAISFNRSPRTNNTNNQFQAVSESSGHQVTEDGVGKLREQLKAKDNAIQEFEKERASYSEQIQQLKSTDRENNKSNEKLREDLKKAKEKADANQRSINDQTATLDTQRKKIEQLGSELQAEKKRSEELGSQLDAEKKKTEKLVSELDAEKKKSEKLEIDMLARINEIIDLKQQLALKEEQERNNLHPKTEQKEPSEKSQEPIGVQTEPSEKPEEPIGGQQQLENQAENQAENTETLNEKSEETNAPKTTSQQQKENEHSDSTDNTVTEAHY